MADQLAPPSGALDTSKQYSARFKTERGDTSVDQERVHAILAQAIDVYVIRPRDWDRLVGLLQ